MTDKRPAHRPSRRPLILRAALDELCEVGAGAGELASMVPIAERSGVTPAAMYYHFKSKADLLVALVDYVEPDVYAFADEAPVQDDPQAWARDVMAGFFQWVRQDPAAARFYFITAAAVAAPEVNAAYDASQHGLAERLSSRLQEIGGTTPDVLRWVQGIALVSIMHEVVSISLQHRAQVSRGFAALEKAALQLATSTVS